MESSKGIVQSFHRGGRWVKLNGPGQGRPRPPFVGRAGLRAAAPQFLVLRQTDGLRGPSKLTPSRQPTKRTKTPVENAKTTRTAPAGIAVTGTSPLSPSRSPRPRPTAGRSPSSPPPYWPLPRSLGQDHPARINLIRTAVAWRPCARRRRGSPVAPPMSRSTYKVCCGFFPVVNL